MKQQGRKVGRKEEEGKRRRNEERGTKPTEEDKIRKTSTQPVLRSSKCATARAAVTHPITIPYSIKIKSTNKDKTQCCHSMQPKR